MNIKSNNHNSINELGRNAGRSESRKRGDFSGLSFQIKVDSVAASPVRKERGLI